MSETEDEGNIEKNIEKGGIVENSSNLENKICYKSYLREFKGFIDW